MKRTRLLILGALLLAAACTPAAAPAENPSDEEESAVTKLIDSMYSHRLFEDYGFIRKHCSDGLRHYLTDRYDYVHDEGEEVYAVWEFRTDQNGGEGPDSLLCVKPSGNGWYDYEFLDGGTRGRNRLHATLQDGVIVFDSIRHETL